MQVCYCQRLNQAREKAKAIKCAGNLKQIGLAMGMYSDDYDEHFPAARQKYQGYDNNWGDVLRKTDYFGASNNKAFKTGANTPLTCPSMRPQKYKGAYYTYGYRCLSNSYYNQFCFTGGKYIAVKIYRTDLSYHSTKTNYSQYTPSEGIYMTDSWNPASYCDKQYFRTSSGVATDYHVRLIHNSRANAIFFDGHVAAKNGIELGKNKIRYAWAQDGVLRLQLY